MMEKFRQCVREVTAERLARPPLRGSPPVDAQLCRVRCIKALTNGWSRASTTKRRLLLLALLPGGWRKKIALKSVSIYRRVAFSMKSINYLVAHSCNHMAQACDLPETSMAGLQGRKIAACVVGGVPWLVFCQRMRSSATWLVTGSGFVSVLTQPRTVYRIARVPNDFSCLRCRTVEVEVNLSWPRLAHRCRTNASALVPTVTVKSRFGGRAVLNKFRGIAQQAECAPLDRPSWLGDATRHSDRRVCDCAKCVLEFSGLAELHTLCRRGSCCTSWRAASVDQCRGESPTRQKSLGIARGTTACNSHRARSLAALTTTPDLDGLSQVAELQQGGVPGCGLARAFPIVVAAECGVEGEALQCLRRMLHEPTLWQLIPDTALITTSIRLAHRLCCRAGAAVHEKVYRVHDRFPYRLFLELHNPRLAASLQDSKALLSGPFHERVPRALRLGVGGSSMCLVVVCEHDSRHHRGRGVSARGASQDVDEGASETHGYGGLRRSAECKMLSQTQP